MSKELIKKAEEEKALTGVLWQYLNPLTNQTIEKAATFDLLLLLIFSVNR
jgi:hypothetical protein